MERPPKCVNCLEKPCEDNPYNEDGECWVNSQDLTTLINSTPGALLGLAETGLENQDQHQPKEIE